MVRNIGPSVCLFLSNIFFSHQNRLEALKPPPPRRTILLLLLWCLQWLAWIWWHRCVFPASILTSTASSYFRCGALEFRWVIKYRFSLLLHHRSRMTRFLFATGFSIVIETVACSGWMSSGTVVTKQFFPDSDRDGGLQRHQWLDVVDGSVVDERREFMLKQQQRQQVRKSRRGPTPRRSQ
uniref:Uncharacterized protein n=1 Tax=Lactuca sativa TaxID=4236 RepID=A0A9R1VWY5_LACSA|nr:hypothetical protein LSAT_V11C400189180 [Lactuca sativa]